jgi:tRNA G18 (ribose-2'-O)-methylase SpoU
LEQAEDSLNLYQYAQTGPVALVLGNEVTGVSTAVQELADATLELPMIGAKESLNVAVAAGIAMYQLRFGSSAEGSS